MARPKPRPRVQTRTRVEIMQDAAERFIALADRNPDGVQYQMDKLEVMFGMKLIRDVRITLFDSDFDPVAGLLMHFCWDTNQAMLEKDGEDISEDKLNEFGTLSSITDTMAVLRDYVDGLFDKGLAKHVSVHANVRYERVAELGQDRYYEIMGYKKPGQPARKPTEAEMEAYRKEQAKIQARRKEKATKRVIVLPDLPEVSVEAW